jgi:toxin FitB
LILDTNVLSALMQRVPEPRVVKWLDEQPQLLTDDLEGRVLDFDGSAAEAAALLAAKRQRAGRPVDIRDTRSAGIVLARHARFATRNVKHFSDLGARVVNPWEPASFGHRVQDA